MESILTQVGSCGRFQAGHVILTQLTRLISVWGVFTMVYGLYKPSWRCQSTNLELNVSQPISMWNYSHLLLNSSLEIPGNGNSTDSEIDFSEKNYYNGTCDMLAHCSKIEFDNDANTIVSEFGLICDKSWIPRLMISINMLGVLFGSLFGGMIGEWFGRKVSLYGSTVIFSVSCAFSALPESWQMYAMLTFFLGFGSGSILSTCFVFGTEFLNSRWRGYFGSIPVLNIGLFTFCLLAFALKDWRLIHITISLIGFTVALGFFWVPESIRWLAVHGEHEKVEYVATKIARINRKSPPSSEEMARVTDSIGAAENYGTNKASYLDLFRDVKLRMITLKTSVMWLLLIMCYYAANYGLSSLSGDFYTNILVGSATDLPLFLCVGYFSNKLGRIKATIMLGSVSGSFFLITALLKIIVANEDNAGLISTILIFIAKSFLVAAWSPLTVLSVEVFPTSVRNLSYGYLTMISRVGGMLSPLLIPQDNEGFIVSYSVIGCCMFLTIGILLTMRETNDRPLQDTINDMGNDVAIT